MTFLLPFLLSVMSSAHLLNQHPGAAQLEFSAEQQTGKLTLVGKGRRDKKIAFLGLKVYDAFISVADPTKYVRDESTVLKSLADQSAIGLQIKFLRDVDPERIEGAFKEGLITNKVDLESKPIKEFLTKVIASGEEKKDQVLTILAVRGATEDSIYLENGRGDVQTIKGPPGFIQQIASIWFGETGEETLHALKKSLLKQP